MHVDNLKYLAVWISDHLKSISATKPNFLTNTIVSIIEEKKSETEVRQSLLDSLRSVLKSNTNLFVELLFQKIETGSYMGNAFYGPEPPDKDMPHIASSTSKVDSKPFAKDTVEKKKISEHSEIKVKDDQDSPSNKNKGNNNILLLSKEMDKLRKSRKSISKKNDSNEKMIKIQDSSEASGSKMDFPFNKFNSKSYGQKRRFSSSNDNDSISTRYKSRMYSPSREEDSSDAPFQSSWGFKKERPWKASCEVKKERSWENRKERPFEVKEQKFRNSRDALYVSEDENFKLTSLPVEKCKSTSKQKSIYKRNYSSDSSNSDSLHKVKRHLRSLSPIRKKKQFDAKSESDKRILKSYKHCCPIENSSNSDNEIVRTTRKLSFSPERPARYSEYKKPRSELRKAMELDSESDFESDNIKDNKNSDRKFASKVLRIVKHKKTFDDSVEKKNSKKYTKDTESSNEGSDKEDFKPVSNKSRAVYGKCGPTCQKEMLISDTKHQSNENLPSASQEKSKADSNRTDKVRCKNFDEKGYCMLGDFCPFDHGINPVVFDNGSNPIPLLALPLQDSNMRMIHPHMQSGLQIPPPLPYNPLYSTVSREQYDPERPSIVQPIGRIPFPPPLRPFHDNPMTFPPFSSSPIPRPGSEGSYSGPRYISPHVNLNNFIPAQNARHHYHSANYNSHRQSLHLNQNLIHLTFKEYSTKPKESLSQADTSVNEKSSNTSGVNENSENIKSEDNKSATSPEMSRALEIRNIPFGCDKIGVLNDEFSKFGKVTNIQLRFNGNPTIALLHYNTRKESEKAYEHYNSPTSGKPYKIYWYNDDDDTNNVASNSIDNKSIRPHPFRRRHVISNTQSNKNYKSQSIELKSKPKEDLREELTRRRLLCKQKMKGFLTACVSNAKALIEKRSRTTDDSEKEVIRQLLLELASKVIEIREWDGGDKPKEIQDLLHDFASMIQKEILDAELDMYSKERKGHSIIEISKTLNNFKRKLEILNDDSRTAVENLKTNTIQVTKTFPPKHTPITIRKIDNRPKSFLIKYRLEFADQNKRAELGKFLSHLQGKEDVKEIDNVFIVSFKTRRYAEDAFGQMLQYWKKFCIISWLGEDLSKSAAKFNCVQDEQKDFELES